MTRFTPWRRWWRQPPKGVHFPHAKGVVGMFSHGRSPVVKVLFILAAQPPTTTLTAEGRVNLQNPLNLLNPHAQRACQKTMKIYSVNACSRLLAGRMKKDYVFSHVAVRGMISSVHAHFSGVTYFTLLGEESRLFCLIGRMGGAFLTRSLESGMEATVLGDISFNASSGWPVLFVERVMDVQKSRDAEEKHAMMKELEEKGYFDPFRKKWLPPAPPRTGTPWPSRSRPCRRA